MTDDTPHRPAPLTDQEREDLLEGAMASNTGHAIQGVYLQSLTLKRWFSPVDDDDLENLLEARSEAPDGGMEASQKALDELSVEERAELLERAIELFRVGCMEALLQLERLMLGLWEDPRSIRADLVATVAGLPIVARGERMLG
jgi:hypothetical protein